MYHMSQDYEMLWDMYHVFRKMYKIRAWPSCFEIDKFKQKMCYVCNEMMRLRVYGNWVNWDKLLEQWEL